MSSSEFSRASSFDKLQTRLSQFWDVIRDLRADSTQEEWDQYTSYLNPDCVLYLRGIGAAPCKGPAEATAAMKTLLTYWKLKERRVLSEGMDLAGTTMMVNMNNRLEILGEGIEFPEMEVVQFDNQGRIVDYKLYCDPTPIMAIFKKAKEAQEKS